MSNGYNTRLPVKREPSPPPAPIWQQAAPVVVRGAALVAAGVVGEWLLRSAARKAIALPFSGKKSRAVARNGDLPVVALEETVIVRRRIIRKG